MGQQSGSCDKLMETFKHIFFNQISHQRGRHGRSVVGAVTSQQGLYPGWIEGLSMSSLHVFQVFVSSLSPETRGSELPLGVCIGSCSPLRHHSVQSR